MFTSKLSVTCVVLVCVMLAAGCTQQHPAGETWAHSPQQIKVHGTHFKAVGKPIWINGANTPWMSWNDFGGKFDYAKWDSHFAQLAANGINASRVWITCNGAGGVVISEDGVVSGATDAHWRDLDGLFEIARKHQVYILATLMSFDHFKQPNANYLAWRKLVAESSKMDSYVQNYVIPFIQRYRGNPYLFAVETSNEIEWVFDNPRMGKVDVGNLQLFVAKVAKAVHDHSDVLVTQGTAVIKWDFFTDEQLRAKLPDPAAHVDFYSPHAYDWQTPYFGEPFYMSPTAYKVRGDKPAIIGECPARGTKGHTIREDYNRAYLAGWAGVMAWTSNGVDRNGDLKQLGEATRFMRIIYPEEIRSQDKKP